jgi:predicted enzyme related to lactoylglutathione lyase
MADPECHVVGLATGLRRALEQARHADTVSAPVVQFEITGRDSVALRRFYAILFGWTMRTTGSLAYSRVLSDDAGIPGAVGDSWDGGPGQATIVVEVDNLEGTLDLAEVLGGKAIGASATRDGQKAEWRGRYYEVPQTGIRFAYVADPDGHVVGIAQGLQRALAQFELGRGQGEGVTYLRPSS